MQKTNTTRTQSEKQNKFHYDVEEKIYDYTTGTAVKEYQTIHNTIDYWLENSTINEIRFTI